MKFVKYQGTGNDFIILDGRNQSYDHLDVKQLCDRRFGIGADGLMILKNHPEYDFEMVYYNSDGNLSSMCGNGGRCLAHFAHSLGLGDQGRLNFIAVDGAHPVFVSGDYAALGMRDTDGWEQRGEDVFILNTGSPHYVWFTTNEPAGFNLIDFAHSVRYSPEFAKSGINVNVVRITGPDSIQMRTYERGVEDETLSCGTGVTAAALALQIKTGNPVPEVKVSTPGGNLTVQSLRQQHTFINVILSGPAIAVFHGEI